MFGINARRAGSIIIPAYNEAGSIARCLSSLLRDARPGEFELIVVCNGCTDETAAIARGFGEGVRVLELAEGSKTAAVNAGNAAASCDSRLYVDADLELSTANARALLDAVSRDGWLAAVGRMELDLAGAPALLRQYYSVWLQNGYLAQGKFGGAYALSREGREFAGPLPRVINDDEYLRRKLPAARVCLLPDCSFKARPPRTFRDLYKVRCRVHRGNRQLDAMGLVTRRVKSGWNVLALGWRNPRLIPGVAAYIVLNALARRAADPVKTGWERDESSRRPAVTGRA
jgi:glycosyltransferase involved in cell wall biosynthesis